MDKECKEGRVHLESVKVNNKWRLALKTSWADKNQFSHDSKTQFSPLFESNPTWVISRFWNFLKFDLRQPLINPMSSEKILALLVFNKSGILDKSVS